MGISRWKRTCQIPFGAALWFVSFAIAQAPASRVEGMQFISSANPQVRLKRDASQKFLGVVPFSIDGLAAGHRFVFVSVEGRGRASASGKSSNDFLGFPPDLALCGGIGHLADLLLDCLLLTIQHHLVEGMGQRFATGVGAGLIGARLDSRLREL
jgi:hypothetical protein